MVYQPHKQTFVDVLEQIKTEGLYKDERYICSPQGSQISVQYPEKGPQKNPREQGTPKIVCVPQRKAHLCSGYR